MRIKYALLLSLVLHASAFVAMDIYLDWKMKNALLALLQKKGGAKGSKYDEAPVKKPIPPRIVQVEIFSPPKEKSPGPKGVGLIDTDTSMDRSFREQHDVFGISTVPLYK